jgi:hypothetical protein
MIPSVEHDSYNIHLIMDAQVDSNPISLGWDICMDGTVKFYEIAVSQ